MTAPRAATATRVESAGLGASRPSAPASGYEATLLSAASDAPPAPGRRRWPWLVVLVAAGTGAAVIWSQSSRDRPLTAPSVRVSASTPTASMPSPIAPAAIATTAPAPSVGASADGAAVPRAAHAAPSAKPASSPTRAGQHDLEQENPFK